MDFGNGLARVRYELRATVGVVWKEERRMVVVSREVDVVASPLSLPSPDMGGSGSGNGGRREAEGVVVGEQGKIWVHGRLVGVGGFAVAGESACVELQVKNHSNKKVCRPSPSPSSLSTYNTNK